ncbi:MAG: methyltransferase domain-containing protein [Candidatus Thiodiazotropha sp. (ex Dulcina madagascariensis)]|nr:methyltransferase domain-containing protein [Candidatus Thiodiazotropha sp. (ex Dulcina madagascariensis)]MCU7928279.1 methyltransferase domain-containing protein [Candidatus Thiodiazotropha sp. (ex Dulcina madagascariensis)]
MNPEQRPAKGQKVRDAVAKTYGQAISQGTGYCGDRLCTADSLPQAIAIGYTAEELQGLPRDMAETTFGCGNPLAFGGVREGDVVIDLGSGAGLDLLVASHKVGSAGRVIGIDMTDEMIVRARQNIDAAGMENVEVRKGYIEDLPVETGSADWVISNCVINLSPEKGRVFSEIARVLEPGGQMLVTDIVVDRLPFWVKWSMKLHSACVAGAIGEAEYLEGLRAAGLEGVEVRKRKVYGAGEIEVLLDSGELPMDRPRLWRILAGLGVSPSRQIAKIFADKVWSAAFYARKPEVPA